MVFSSLFFVFFFLVCNLITYHLVGTMRQKNIVMLIFSLIFYAWAGPKYLLLLISMVFVSWLSACLMDRYPDAPFRKYFLVGDCAIMLGLLCIFKYLPFFAGITHTLFHFPAEILNIALPIGISFYTFQLLSYVVDVYHQKVHAQTQYWKLLLYASMFHQCIAGPIVRYQTIADEIDHRQTNPLEISHGIKRFCVGLAKKAILANGCATVVANLLPTEVASIKGVPAAGLWIGLLFFTLEIYLDFSAYSDMAIGMGLMIGFHYQENFNYPYIASSIKDFWRRWHISLSTFFRDYVYIPLGGNRKGSRRTLINLLIVWALTGFWHGASWNYLFWGLYFFLFIVLEKYYLEERLSRLPRWVSHLYAMLVVYFGWALFYMESSKSLGTMLIGMFGLNSNGFLNTSVTVTIQNNIYLLLFAILASTPLPKQIGDYLRHLLSNRLRVPYPAYVYDMIMPPLLLVLSMLALVGDSYNPFLYFRF